MNIIKKIIFYLFKFAKKSNPIDVSVKKEDLQTSLLNEKTLDEEILKKIQILYMNAEVLSGKNIFKTEDVFKEEVYKIWAEMVHNIYFVFGCHCTINKDLTCFCQLGKNEQIKVMEKVRYLSWENFFGKMQNAREITYQAFFTVSKEEGKC